MKALHLMALLALATASCQKPAAPTTEVTPESTPSAQLPALTPEPKVVAATPKPTPRLAADGVFYLLKGARVETDAGVVGLVPGTQVKRLRAGIYQSSEGEVALSDDQITNDLDLADKARGGDAARQRALRETATSDISKSHANISAIGSARHAADALALQQRSQRADETRLAGLVRQQAVIDTQVTELAAQNSKEQYNRRVRDRVVGSSTAQRLEQARAAQTNTRAEITILERKIRQSARE